MDTIVILQRDVIFLLDEVFNRKTKRLVIYAVFGTEDKSTIERSIFFHAISSFKQVVSSHSFFKLISARLINCPSYTQAVAVFIGDRMHFQAVTILHFHLPNFTKSNFLYFAFSILNAF